MCMRAYTRWFHTRVHFHKGDGAIIPFLIQSSCGSPVKFSKMLAFSYRRLHFATTAVCGTVCYGRCVLVLFTGSHYWQDDRKGRSKLAQQTILQVDAQKSNLYALTETMQGLFRRLRAILLPASHFIYLIKQSISEHPVVGNEFTGEAYGAIYQGICPCVWTSKKNGLRLRLRLKFI